MSVTIPAGDGVSSFFDLQVTLDDVTYTIEVKWNVRMNAWFMHVFDAEGQIPLIQTLRLVVGPPGVVWLINAYNTGGPPGGFAVVDTSGRGEDPDFEGFGTRWILKYLTRAEIAAG